jgi:hypothetical protein
MGASYGAGGESSSTDQSDFSKTSYQDGPIVAHAQSGDSIDITRPTTLFGYKTVKKEDG